MSASAVINMAQFHSALQETTLQRWITSDEVSARCAARQQEREAEEYQQRQQAGRLSIRFY